MMGLDTFIVADLTAAVTFYTAYKVAIGRVLPIGRKMAQPCVRLLWTNNKAFFTLYSFITDLGRY